jgi:NTP pyrophosphatase (non-canonical NTP hydrolase)
MKTEVDHLLLTLAEECAETTQRVTKAQRWGLNEVQPGQELNNEQRLRYELNDVFAVVELLYERHGVVLVRDNEMIIAKKSKVLHFMQYAREIGELEPSHH